MWTVEQKSSSQEMRMDGLDTSGFFYLLLISSVEDFLLVMRGTRTVVAGLVDAACYCFVAGGDAPPTVGGSGEVQHTASRCSSATVEDGAS